MVKRQAKPKPKIYRGHEGVKVINKWFTSLWGQHGGCVVAQEARRVLKIAIRKKLTVEEMWLISPEPWRGSWASRLHYNKPWKDSSSNRDRGAITTLLANHTGLSPAFNKAAEAELRRLDPNPTLVGVYFNRGVFYPFGVWKTRKR